MNERPTPETDAETMRDEYDHVDSDLGPFAPSDTVPAEFARKLERERDEARELFISSKRARASLSKACDSLQKELRETKRERDEAREALAEEIKFHHRTHSELVQTQCQMQDVIRERDEAIADYQRVCKERDEAREQLAAAKHFLEKYIAERDEARKERDALRDAVNALHDYVHGKRNDDKDISEILNGAMKI